MVTPKLGNDIEVGSKVTVEGPFGHAFLRSDHVGRIVLLGSGTGFAPIWPITAAARKTSPDRPMALICGAKDAHAFYVEAALREAHRHVGTFVGVVVELQHPNLPEIPTGTPADHMPALSADAIVFAAGSPRMVEKAGAKAGIAGACFYSDPFSPRAPSKSGASMGFQRVARPFGAARNRASGLKRVTVIRARISRRTPPAWSPSAPAVRAGSWDVRSCDIVFYHVFTMG